jgi:hypothetical protein
MKENCILDYDCVIKIPQNEKKIFNIKKSENWKNSIDIEFDIKEEINILNLFIIIKSYIKNIEFFCFKMSTIVKKKENIFVTENLMINQFIKMSYWDFEIWIIDKIYSETRYISEEEDLYAIRVSFQKKIIEGLNSKYKKDVLEYLKPSYPWKKDIIEDLKLKNYIKESEIEKIIKKLEENSEKKTIIDDLKNLLNKLK